MPLTRSRSAPRSRGEAAQSAGEIEPAHLAFEDHAESVDAVGVGGDRLGRHRRSGRPAARRTARRRHRRSRRRGTRSARSLSASSRRTRSGPSGARSVLVITSVSASAACRPASAKRSRLSAPFTASTRVTTRAKCNEWSSIGSAPSVKRIGAGSASPVVSIDDPAKPPDFAGLAPLEKAAQGAREILAHGAAQAPAGQFQHTALDKIDEVVVDRDLADLVDDDGGVGEGGRDERAAQQRRFAAAEKPGQHGRRQGFRSGHA